MDAQSTMDAQLTRSKGLMDMPLELLTRISFYLDTTDYGMLRRSCKHFEASLFSAFGREFFTKRQFMFTEFSLQALVDISNSRYGPYLTYLILSLERPKVLIADPTMVRTFGRPSPLVAPLNDAKFNNFREESISHQVFTSTGQDQQMLIQALENLPNLKTIGLRNWSAQGRYRDGPRATWNTYGATTILRETHMDLQRNNVIFRNDDYPPHVFRTILVALGKAKARPERFEVILRGTALTDSSFHIPRYLESTMTPVLSNLKALFLDLNDWFPAPRTGAIDECPSVALKGFLCRAKSLEHLRLNFQDWKGPNGCKQLLQWLEMHPSSFQDPQALSVPMKTPGDPTKFANLSRIDIGYVTIESDDLVRLYKAYGSMLRSISLHRVTLRRDMDEQEIAQADEQADEQQNINLWADLINMLSVAGLSQLSEISITRPCQTIEGGAGSTRKHIIMFEDSSPSWEMRWSGHDLNKGLKEIKKAMVVKKGVSHE